MPSLGADPASSVPSSAARAGRPLKILQVSYNLELGGLQRMVLEMAFGLKRLGHEVHVCSLRGRGPLEAELARGGIRTWIMPWPEGGIDRTLFLKVFRLLRDQRYDVVHTHNTQAFVDGGLAALLARVPVRVHTDHARPFPDKARYMLQERLMSLAYDKVVGVSRDTADNLRRYEGIKPPKLTVIVNGVDASLYRREKERLDVTVLRREAGLENFSTVLGIGARLEEEKGARYVIEAMPAITARHPAAALAIAGTGSQEGLLKARTRELGVQGSVRFLGAYPQLAAFYPMIDCYVHPSLREGMPLGLLEAMSLGLPVVATRVGGVGQLLTHGVNALLVEPGDPGALAGAVLEVLSDSARASALGQEARRLFDTQYDSAVMVRNYVDLYRQCLADGDR